MKILTVGIDDEYIKLIRYVFPGAVIQSEEFDSVSLGGTYEMVFITHLDGWEDTMRDVQVLGKGILVVTSEPDISLIENAAKYNISIITTMDGLETELKALAKRYSRLGVQTKTPQIKPKGMDNERQHSYGVDETNIYISKFKSLIIAVTGSKGGTGKSAISVNLAAAIAQNMNLKVGLIDFDLKNHSCIANRLTLNYTRTLKVFADKVNPEKMPNLFMGHPYGFYVLPGLENSGESTLITLGVIDKIIKYAAATLDVVIFDLSANPDTATLRALELANIKYIVTGCSWDAFKRLESFLAYPEYQNSKIIVNQVPESYKKILEKQIQHLQEKYPVPVVGRLRIEEYELLSWAEGRIPVLDPKCKSIREDFQSVLKDVKDHIIERIPSKGQKQPRGIFRKMFSNAN